MCAWPLSLPTLPPLSLPSLSALSLSLSPFSSHLLFTPWLTSNALGRLAAQSGPYRRGEKAGSCGSERRVLFPLDNAIISVPLVRNARFHRPLPSSERRAKLLQWAVEQPTFSPSLSTPACPAQSALRPPSAPCSGTNQPKAVIATYSLYYSLYEALLLSVCSFQVK